MQHLGAIVLHGQGGLPVPSAASAPEPAPEPVCSNSMNVGCCPVGRVRSRALFFATGPSRLTKIMGNRRSGTHSNHGQHPCLLEESS